MRGAILRASYHLTLELDGKPVRLSTLLDHLDAVAEEARTVLRARAMNGEVTEAQWRLLTSHLERLEQTKRGR